MSRSQAKLLTELRMPAYNTVGKEAADEIERLQVKLDALQITFQLHPSLTRFEALYERFTDRARKVMQLANQEAQRFNHEYIGTEHILLGLIAGNGVAANVLKNLDVDLRKIRLEVEKLLQSGPDMVSMGKLPQTPRAKKVIEYSMEEARNLAHNYVGTEHILLGLLREQEGPIKSVAARVLMDLGLKLEEVRKEILNLLNDADTDFEAWPKAAQSNGDYECVEWVDSRSHDDWTTVANIEMKVATITTLGHLVNETPDVLCIASTRDARTDQYSCLMFIPKRCILSRRACHLAKDTQT